MRLRNVLLPTDFSDSADGAVPYAVYLSTRCDATLHLFHAVVHSGELAEDEAKLAELEEDIARRMERVAKLRLGRMLTAHDFGDVPLVKAHAVCDAAAPAILTYAERNGVDLIVMGTHGRRGIRRLILGSVAEEIIRRAQCPVLTVREREADQSQTTVERILAPVDFSEPSLQALAYAKHLADIYHARLQLLHVVPQLVQPSFYARRGNDFMEFESDIIGKAKAEMLQRCDEVEGPEVSVEAHAVAGRPAYEIIRFAERQQSDLIVIATQGLTGLSLFLIGSVAQRVARRAPCPVLSINPRRRG
jgi:nucleotide-binding universal stress UspA family protein